MSLSYLLFGLLLDQQGSLSQLIHLSAELQVLLMQLEPLLADTGAVVPSSCQGALQTPHFLLTAVQLLSVAIHGSGGKGDETNTITKTFAGFQTWEIVKI